MKTTKLLFLSLFLSILAQVNAQNVGINEDGALPDASAILDVQSENKGVLIPRMTEVQRMAIAVPATGLMVYQTNNDDGFYYYDGAAWEKLGAGAGSGFWDNDGDAIYNLNTGSVGVGTQEPGAKLDVVNDGFGIELGLDGSAQGATEIQMITHDGGPLNYGGFNISANEYDPLRPAMDILFQRYDFDLVHYSPLVRFEAFSDTALTVYNDVLSTGRFHGLGARFAGDESLGEVVYISSDHAGYGLHVDVNSAYGTGIATHTTNNADAFEAYSENGNAAYLTAWGEEGHALITGRGDVGIGTQEPDARVHVEEQTPGKTEMVLESPNRASLGFRINNGEEHSYQQYWLDATNDGVNLWQQDYSEDPDAGTAISSASPIVDFGDSHAVNAHGDINLNGEMTNEGKTGSANLLPIAYGAVRSNGSVNTGTGNFSCNWNSSLKRYEINIQDESYYYLNYITQVTPMTGGRQVTTGSIGGKLTVYIYDTNGNKVQGSFHFVTYKP